MPHDPILAFRNDIPAYSEGIYMNHAAVSPFSIGVKKALDEYGSMRSSLPVDVYPTIIEMKGEMKRLIAKLVGAESSDHIALTDNTGRGLNIVASGFPWKPGDRVVLPSVEFPANVYPWMNLQRQGVLLDWVEPREGRITADDIEQVITSSTRMVAISYVQFLSGFRADLKAIGDLCRDRGIWFVVDGIQGVGVSPIDVRECNIHALSVGGHKWLMWPMGTGFLSISPDLSARLQPAHAGWLSVKEAWNFLDYRLDLLDGAERFEIGTLNFMGFHAARQVLASFLEIGIEQIASGIERLTARLIEGLETAGLTVLTPSDPAFRAGIVSAVVEDPERVMAALQERKIHAAVRAGIVRFSPHAFNTMEEVERVLEAVTASLPR